MLTFVKIGHDSYSTDQQPVHTYDNAKRS